MLNILECSKSLEITPSFIVIFCKKWPIKVVLCFERFFALRLIEKASMRLSLSTEVVVYELGCEEY